MKNTLRLTESEFSELVKRLVNESKNEIDDHPNSSAVSAATVPWPLAPIIARRFIRRNQ